MNHFIHPSTRVYISSKRLRHHPPIFILTKCLKRRVSPLTSATKQYHLYTGYIAPISKSHSFLSATGLQSKQAARLYLLQAAIQKCAGCDVAQPSSALHSALPSPASFAGIFLSSKSQQRSKHHSQIKSTYANSQLEVCAISESPHHLIQRMYHSIHMAYRLLDTWI